MPSYTTPVALDGPIADILLSVPVAVQRQLTAAGRPIPPPVQVRALIDTGASGSCINPAIVQALGLLPVGTTPVSTPTTQAPVHCNLYSIDLYFLQSQIGVPGIVVTETPLGGQTIQMLVGRDVLRHGVLIYIGYANQYTLSF